MKFKLNYIYIIVAVILFSSSNNQMSFNKNFDNLKQEFQRIQPPFVSNKGQLYPDVIFYRSTRDECFYLTKEGEIIYSVPVIDNNINSRIVLKEKIKNSQIHEAGSKKRSKLKLNYFRGSDRSYWTRNTPVFDVVEAGGLYKGISMELRSGTKNVEKVFYIDHGTDGMLIIDTGHEDKAKDLKTSAESLSSK